LIECGFLSNSNDEAFITNKDNQKKIALNILNAIENYANQNSLVKDDVDTIPPMYYQKKKLTGMEVQTKTNTIKARYADGTSEVISKEEAQKRGFVLPPPPPPGKTYKGKKVRSVEGISDEKVTINFLDGTKETITREEAKKAGFILFTPPKTVKDTIPKKVYTKVENEAFFPGGPSAWITYITHQIQASIDSFTNADYGTCVVRFIVNTDGTVSDVKATTMQGTHLAKITIDAIRKGPKWIPASQNGHIVAAYRLQPVTLKNPEKPNETSSTNKPAPGSTDDRKIFVKSEQPATFPGGQTAWLKYLSRVFDKNGNELMSDKKNEGTCEVRFIVSKDGDVSDVQPITMKGTKLADVAVNAIKKGPMWIPGKQNGHNVNSFVTVPVTFKLSDNIMNKNEPE
jgi:bla regulator protein blaR1